MHMPHLAHLSPDKMSTISETTLLNAFSWIKIYEFRLNITDVCYDIGMKINVFMSGMNADKVS